jgi:hypothetical protein
VKVERIYIDDVGQSPVRAATSPLTILATITKFIADLSTFVRQKNVREHFFFF